MGLAKKYLSPSLIAKLAPSSTDQSTAEVSSYAPDYSLASRRYLAEHGLLSTSFSRGNKISTPSTSRRGERMHTPEVSAIPRLTVMEEEEGEEFSFIPMQSRAEETPSAVPSNSEEPILDLEHLRTLPKLL